MNNKLDACHQMSTIRDFITYYVFTYKVRSVDLYYIFVSNGGKQLRIQGSFLNYLPLVDIFTEKAFEEPPKYLLCYFYYKYCSIKSTGLINCTGSPLRVQ